MWSVTFLVFPIFIATVRYVTMSEMERVTYLSVERFNVTYYHPKYIAFANGTARQYSNRDPVHYVNMFVKTLVPVDNQFSVDFYFYEFLSNMYKRGFVEMHFKLCNLIHKDKFFGPALRQGKLAKPCPYPPDEYYLWNMTVPITSIPKGFPFSKGRIYCNITYLPTNEYVAGGHVDMELKQMKRKKNPQ